MTRSKRNSERKASNLKKTTWLDVLLKHGNSICFYGFGCFVALRCDVKDIPKIVEIIVSSNLYMIIGWIIALIESMVLFWCFVFYREQIIPEIKRLCGIRDDSQEKRLNRPLKHTNEILEEKGEG